VRPTSKIPPLLDGLSRIDLTNCSEDEARRRLIKGVDMPAPPELKPAFEKIEGEPPDRHHAGPTEKPTFVRVSDGVPRWLKLSAAIATVVGAVFAALAFFFWREREGMQDRLWRHGGVRRLQRSTGSRAKLKCYPCAMVSERA